MNESSKQSTFSLSPTSLKEAMELSKIMADSDMVPKDFKGKPGNILVAVQMGAEIGLPPTQAIQNIAVINGRPSLWGDAALAVVKAHQMFEWIKETSTDTEATCIIKRKGEDPHTATFSDDDAKRAGLFGKQGPWTQYPNRMKQMRARSFAVRDTFPDALKGISIAEEAQDIPQARDMGAAVVVEPDQTLLPAYSDEDFDKNFAGWAKAVQSGKRTHQQIVGMVNSKATLTDKQIDMIKNVEVAP